MNIGLLHNNRTTNLGDDVQTYALENLLPRVDRMVDRENMNTDECFDHQPTATPMAAWFMGKKWQWPPADCLRPLFISFHYTDFTAYPNKYFRSEYEYISGPGAEYLNAWGPVGCRDLFTMEQLQKRGVEAYFSGCVTLTLPKQPQTRDKGTYVCLVDVPAAVEKKVREIFKDTGKEIRVMTHLTAVNEKLSRKQRNAAVEQLLTIYQNAHCVITKRLHVSLPCLAMETPVILVNANMDPTRFRPYTDWINSMSPAEFLERDVADMLLNPEPNKKDYLPYREDLIRKITEFANHALTVDNIQPRYPLPYTHEQYLQWHNDVMEENLLRWYRQSIKVFKELAEVNAQNKKLSAANKKLTASNKKLAAENKRLAAEIPPSESHKEDPPVVEEASKPGFWKKLFAKK